MFFGFFAGCVRDFQVEAQKTTFVVIFVAVEKHMFGVFCIFASVGAKLENFCVASSLAVGLGCLPLSWRRRLLEFFLGFSGLPFVLKEIFYCEGESFPCWEVRDWWEIC